MSNLGKILLYVALVGALAAAAAGFFILQKRGEDKIALQTANTNLTQAQQKVKAEETALEKAQQDVKDAQDKTAQATAQVEKIKADTATLQQQATDAATALAKSQQDAKDSAEKLKAITDKLAGADPQTLISDKQKAVADLQAAQAETKIIQDQVDGLKKQLADKVDEINRANDHGKMPPGVSGKVTFVDKTWNFVVLNVGLSNGVVPNGELIVYRGRTFLGKIRVTKAEENDAVAEILPDTKGDIQVGDIVLN